MKGPSKKQMKPKAVIYARAASARSDGRASVQEQLKLCRKYARSKALKVDSENVEIGAADRPAFRNMTEYLKEQPQCRTVLVATTDLCRNFQDYVTMQRLTDELDLEVHFLKEGQVMRRESEPQNNQMIMLRLLSQEYYLASLRERVDEGLSRKAQTGFYPGRAPLGYRNNPANRPIKVDGKAARAVRRIFSLYATGKYSLEKFPAAVRQKLGLRISRHRLARILGNSFYGGRFAWRDKIYKGKHALIIKPQTYRRVQRLLKTGVKS